MSSVLLISFKRDPHIARVSSFLKKKKQEFFLLASDDFGGNNHISFTTSDKEHTRLTLEKNNIPLRSIGAAHWRKPHIWLPERIMEMTNDEINNLNHQKKETLTVIYELQRILRNQGTFLLNDTEDMRIASPKLPELLLASELGFTIPDTLVSTSQEILSEFCDKHNQQVVTKYFGIPSSYLVKDDHATFTHPVSKQVLKSYFAKKHNAYPIQLQKKISKQFDLRITVVGNKLFPCKIESQKKESTQTDVRRGNFNELSHSRYELPKRSATCV